MEEEYMKVERSKKMNKMGERRRRQKIALYVVYIAVMLKKSSVHIYGFYLCGLDLKALYNDTHPCY